MESRGAASSSGKAAAKRLLAAQLAVALCTLAVCVSLWLALSSSASVAGFEWVNHDVGNILYLGQRMLAGDRLYADLAEANPPGIFFVAEFVAALSARLHVSPIHIFHALVMLLAVFGVWVIQSVHARANRPVALCLSAAAFLLILSGGLVPGDRALARSFGQREQLFALGFLPYLVWRLSGQGVRFGLLLLCWLVGLLASLKPHFAILVGALEVCCLAEDRMTIRRIAPVLALAAVLPYVALLLHSPRSVVALWSETIPLHTRGAYAYFNQPYLLFVRSAQHSWVLIYTGALCYFIWSGAKLPRRSLLATAVLLPLAYALVLQQHKFWDYHAIVLLGLVAVLSYTAGATLIERVPRDRALPLFGLLLLAAAAQNFRGIASLRAMTSEWQTGSGEEARLLKIAPLLTDRRRVLYYSTSIAHMRLALWLGQHTIGRWNHNLTYPALVREPNPERRREGLSRYCADQRQLIATEKPDAVVFHATRQGLQSREQELLELLVDRCAVVPEREYRRASVVDVPEVAVFLRLAGPANADLPVR